jgi:RNA polymerase sigma-70 factor (ECF subfamily)
MQGAEPHCTFDNSHASRAGNSTVRVNSTAPPASSGAVDATLRARPFRVTTRFEPRHASDDAELVRRSREGDEAAFTQLYVRYARMIHGVLLARVSIAEVDDLVQEVFFTAWKGLDGLRDPAAFGGWLSTIAKNRATDFHRHRVESTELPAHLEAPGDAGAPAEARMVLDVIRALPDAYRETLVLRLVEGMTGPEIADRTGLTPASVRVNLHRGMKLLRERLQR